MTEDLGKVYFYVYGNLNRGCWAFAEEFQSSYDILELLENCTALESATSYTGLLQAGNATGLAEFFLEDEDRFDVVGFVDCKNHPAPIDAKAAYVETFGEWDAEKFDISHGHLQEIGSWKDLAYRHIADDLMLEDVPYPLCHYIDFDRYSKMLMETGDWEECNGYFFDVA